MSEDIINNESRTDSDYEVTVENIEKLKNELQKEKQKAIEFENKFKRALADFQNLERRTSFDIEQSVNKKIDQFLKDFLQIMDDLERAKTAISKTNSDSSGLEAILKNMNSFLVKNGISSIDSVGNIFDPNLHEALAILEDNSLDDGTITKEIRKGYISQNRVIRPALVEVSKKTE